MSNLVQIPHPSKKKCTVHGCPTPIAATIHKFPKTDIEKVNLWRQICGVTKKASNLFICSNHFEAKDFYNINNTKALKKTAIPSRNLPSLDHEQNIDTSKIEKSCVLGCDNKLKKYVHYHNFPLKYFMRKRWISACKLDKASVTNTSLLCNSHFKEEDYLTAPESKNQALKSTSVPSLNLPERSQESEENVTTFIYVPSNNEKLKDMKSYRNHSIVHIDVDTPSNNDLESSSYKMIQESDCENVQPNQSVESKSKLSLPKHVIQNFDSMNNIYDTDDSLAENQTRTNFIPTKDHSKRTLSNFREENSVKRKCEVDIRYKSILRTVCASCGKIFKLNQENDTKNIETLAAETLIQLQEVRPSNEIEHVQLTKKGIEICDKVLRKESLNLLDLLTNDSELTTFTGINFELLDRLTELVKLDESNSIQKSCLPAKERIVMCLCKLRLNLSFGSLAMLFSTDEQFCINNFFSLIKHLSKLMEKTICWPKTEELIRNLPECFQSFKQTRVILNCCEVLIEKQMCPNCQDELVLEKKQESSIKFVLGIAPSGLIIFKSEPHEGHESNNSIFTNSKILENLDSTKEAIMTDDTLNIQASCAENNITLIKPSKLGNKKCFSRNDVELIKNIAAARIHVDRTLQRFQMFKIMQAKVSWRLLPYLNNICTVIAGLVNMNNPVLPEVFF